MKVAIIIFLVIAIIFAVGSIAVTVIDLVKEFQNKKPGKADSDGTPSSDNDEDTL